MKKRIAIVVQRAGKDVIGGSEGYALAMAKALCSTFKVDILSTCAKDHVTWRNHYEEGVEKVQEDLNIIRFSNDFERGDYWFQFDVTLSYRMPSNLFLYMDAEEKKELIAKYRKLPLGATEEWIKYEGPYSTGLYDYIKKYEQEYTSFLFMTYLYPTTYFGTQFIKDDKKIFIIPTFHDEPPVYLPIMQRYKKYYHLFLTKAERDLAIRSIYRAKVKNSIIGFGLEDKKIQPSKNVKEKYILYAGRIEQAKGILELYDFFSKYYLKKQSIKLYTIGKGNLSDCNHPGVYYKGFVSEEEKLDLMKNALAFIHPSSLESLGIVLIEAFMVSTPAIVNAKSQVLQDHIKDSKAGFYYDNYEDFENALDYLQKGGEQVNQLGKYARAYYEKMYSLKQYEMILTSLIEKSAIKN